MLILMLALKQSFREFLGEAEVFMDTPEVFIEN